MVSCQDKPKRQEVPTSYFKDTHELMVYKGSVHRLDSFPSKFVAPRTIDVWIPQSYSKDKKYAVLYMQDGQNLFDASNTLNKQEWKVDEISTALMEARKVRDFIVVGIWNVPESRQQDYFPSKAFDLLAQSEKDSLAIVAVKNDFKLSFTGDEYLRFIVEELKPLIDTEFSTLLGAESTFIAGASMGALLSVYAVCEYPKIFGGAMCVSTHWPGFTPSKHNPMPKAIFKYLKAKLPEPTNHTFYFDYGTETLDAVYPQYLETVDDIFFGKGYTEKNYMNLEFEGADHSEASWNRRFDIPLEFFLNKNNDLK